MVNGSDWLDKSESRKYLAGGAGALMTGNVLLSGRDGPTLTASPTPNTGPDRTLGKDRWKKVEEGGRGWKRVDTGGRRDFWGIQKKSGDRTRRFKR